MSRYKRVTKLDNIRAGGLVRDMFSLTESCNVICENYVDCGRRVEPSPSLEMLDDGIEEEI